MSFVSIWPDYHVDALKTNFAAGMSFAENAADLNSRFRTSYSRNAAIGKAKRIGLTQADKPKVASKPRNTSPKPWDEEGIHKRTYYRRKAKDSEPTKPDLITLRCVEVIPLDLDLAAVVERDGCRWPYGDGSYTFCGHPKLNGFSYCGPHVALSIGAGTISERNALRVRSSV
jgi:GcrA cell cycle regulator